MCTLLGLSVGHLKFQKCDVKDRNQRKYMCQMSDTAHGQHAQPSSLFATRQHEPILAKINVVTIGQYGGRWWPAICPNKHLTYVFMACDVSTLCWAGGDAAFSLRPQSWALPSPQSCPVQLDTKLLPPSFQCQSETQRVPYSLVCDHRQDCLDGSDETFCTFLPCDLHYQFQCLNKQVCLVLRSICVCLMQSSYITTLE